MKRRVAKTLYEKRGGKFVPVGKDDMVLPYGFGDYLVRVRKGSKSVHLCKKPLSVDYAKVEVAMAEAADALCSAIMENSRLEPRSRPLTDKERMGFEAYKRVVGEDLTLVGKSASEIAMLSVICLRRALEKSLGAGVQQEGWLETFADRDG